MNEADLNPKELSTSALDFGVDTQRLSRLRKVTELPSLDV